MAVGASELDWPMRDRIPSRHSYVDGKVSGAFRLAWTAELGNTVRSQPIVSGSAVFVNTLSRLHALGIDDGQRKWEFLPLQTRLSEAHSANKGTPTLHAGRILLSDLQGNLYMLDTESGQEIWRTKQYRSRDESACVADGNFFVRFRSGPEIKDRAHGYVCLNMDGEEIWKFNARAEVISLQPAISRGSLVFTDRSGYVYAVSAESGELIWERDLRQVLPFPEGIPRTREYAYGPIVIIGDQILVYYAASSQLISVSLSDGSLSWIHQSEEATYAPASDHEHIYYHWMGGIVPGTVSAVSLRDGQLRWRKEIGMDFKDIRVRSGLVVGNQYLVPFNMSKTIASFSTNTGGLLWSFKGRGGFSGEPVFAQGRLFVGDDRGTLYCFEPA